MAVAFLGWPKGRIRRIVRSSFIFLRQDETEHDPDDCEHPYPPRKNQGLNLKKLLSNFPLKEASTRAYTAGRKQEMPYGIGEEQVGRMRS